MIPYRANRLESFPLHNHPKSSYVDTCHLERYRNVWSENGVGHTSDVIPRRAGCARRPTDRSYVLRTESTFLRDRIKVIVFREVLVCEKKAMLHQRDHGTDTSTPRSKLRYYFYLLLILSRAPEHIRPQSADVRLIRKPSFRTYKGKMCTLNVCSTSGSK